MADIELNLGPGGRGTLDLSVDGAKKGEMLIQRSGDSLTVYHTEVDAEESGKGYAKELLTELVRYAGQENLKIVPLCPYVLAQFKRHPAEYADVWQKSE
jgi:uncharacterized protein